MEENHAENFGYELSLYKEDNFDDISPSYATCGDVIWV